MIKRIEFLKNRRAKSNKNFFPLNQKLKRALNAVKFECFVVNTEIKIILLRKWRIKRNLKRFLEGSNESII